MYFMDHLPYSKRFFICAPLELGPIARVFISSTQILRVVHSI